MSKLKERNVENVFRGINMCKSHGGGKNERGLLQNYVISKLSRKDLEDKFCTAIEKNIFLKKQINSKDEKLKLLGTKLLRLTQQQKKENSLLEHYHPLDKVLEEQSFRIEQLQNINKNLNEKVNVLKRQICAQRHLLASSKGHRPKRINGNVESQKNNGKLNFDIESPRVAQDEIEKYDEFNYAERHSPEDSNDASNDLDSKLKNDNLAESNVDMLKDNLPDQKNLDQQKETSRTHQTKSFVKCVKTKKSLKEVETQTSFDKGVKIPNAYEDVSRQLAQEHMLVLDLQQQLKSAKLTQRVVSEVEELLKALNNKNLFKENEINSTRKENKSNELENSFSLRQELQREKVDLQAQKTMNAQLLFKLSEMQKEIDGLRLKSERQASVIEVVPTASYRNVPPTMKYDTETSSNHSDLKISEHFDHENSKSGSSQNLKNIQSISQNVTFPTSPKSSPMRRQSDVKEIKKAEVLPEPLSDVQPTTPQITNKVPEFNADLKNDDQTSLNVLTIVDIQEIKGDEEDLKSIDGATYNISRNGSDSTDGSVSSPHSQADAYLSDGEIPKEHSLESFRKDVYESDLEPEIQLPDVKSESIPIEVMAESTLKAISQEIDLCTKNLLCAQDENECHCDDPSNWQQNISEDICTNKSICAQDENECCCDDPTNFQNNTFRDMCTDKLLCAQDEDECHCDNPSHIKV